MKRAMFFALASLLASMSLARGAGDAKPAETWTGREPDWSPFLIRDSLVQRALNLNAEQSNTIDLLTSEVDRVIWPWRDLPADELATKLSPLGKKLEDGVHQLLDEQQRTRLLQITLQSQGLRGLLRPELASAFALTPAQTQQIRAIVDHSQEALKKVTAAEREQLKADTARRNAIQTRERDEILALLTDQQKTRWLRLIGSPFNLTAVNVQAIRAPELRDPDVWINSEPLSLSKLRGHVVAVTFWTFGCGNCQHNYPSYKAWDKTLTPKGLTIIGIHTPETQGEHNVDSVRAQAKKNELNFPILIDNDKKNWNAWANNVWPAVYLIDKQGRIRYWWYGELNWKGAPGQKYMTQRIGELLAEK